ncbi:MAG TPA: DNA repair protein RadC [Saprospiraceae bacterium]|nr:DNA repair protein RadC [Saprospiraceae bacterium]
MHQSIKHWSASDQPREKLLQQGSKSLSEAELIAILMRNGTRNRSALDVAKELLGRYDQSLASLAKLSIHDFMQVKGIGEAKAVSIAAALELGRRRATEQALQKNQITSSLDAYELLLPSMRDLMREEFRIILLDRRSRVISIEDIHVGGMSAMVVDPKIIFQKALERKACSLILSHNHPSGSPSPSNEDIRLTEKIKAAGSFIDIKVLDHIIIGDGSYYSFADDGKM